MCIACWIHKATNIRSEYVIRIAFPLQQWLEECASTLRYTYIVCLVSFSRSRFSLILHTLYADISHSLSLSPPLRWHLVLLRLTSHFTRT